MRSRSLGALLGFGSLAFKLESCQPTGSWLDRDAACLVQDALRDGVGGLCMVGDDPLTLPLAIQCARAGLHLLILRCTNADDGWLATLGARQVVVDAAPVELASAASEIAAGAGLRLVEPASSGPTAGLEAVAREVAAAGHAASLLAAPALASTEPAAHLLTPVLGVLTLLDLDVAITAREAAAARLLLAREEGLIASPTGAAALAVLVRAVREDRARRPRERRFPRDPSAVVVLTGEPPGTACDPPAAADAISGRAVALAELMADPRRLLVQPPGSR